MDAPRVAARGSRSAAPVTRRARPRGRGRPGTSTTRTSLFRPPDGGRPVAVHRPAPRRPGPRGVIPRSTAAPPRAARRGAAITSPSATGRVAWTAGSRWPGAGGDRGEGDHLPRRQVSPGGGDYGVGICLLDSLGQRTARCQSRPRPPKRWSSTFGRAPNVPPRSWASTPGTPRTLPPAPGKHSPARVILGAGRVPRSGVPGSGPASSGDLPGRAEFNPRSSPPAPHRL